MASLKEVRGRIASVTSTRKITSAMKLVSASKLRRAQEAIANYLPYQKKLTAVLEDFLASTTDEISLPLAQTREVKRVAIIAISSNGSLCGAFNSNVIKKTEEVLARYKHLPPKDILVYPLGKKVAEALKRNGLIAAHDFNEQVDKPDYNEVAKIADELIELFVTKQIDAVELVYNHFKNAAVQQIIADKYLPMAATIPEGEQKAQANYIIEPNTDYLIATLAPKVMRLRLYSALLDSIAAEHGARTTAMQIATDNAGDLIQELKLKYNKARQEAITNEILDIVGGAEGLK
ncbi:MAG: ATP synthase F1 subunit gamma [Prevotellaceae bacterium]|jgi:F-type H+-transporting ATPase subunit gamma|nr:ATP synthase F1 subunit gamma [Prevotellaceae bacterium]